MADKQQQSADKDKQQAEQAEADTAATEKAAQEERSQRPLPASRLQAEQPTQPPHPIGPAQTPHPSPAEHMEPHTEQANADRAAAEFTAGTPARTEEELATEEQRQADLQAEIDKVTAQYEEEQRQQRQQQKKQRVQTNDNQAKRQQAVLDAEQQAEQQAAANAKPDESGLAVGERYAFTSPNGNGLIGTLIRMHDRGVNVKQDGQTKHTMLPWQNLFSVAPADE